MTRPLIFVALIAPLLLPACTHVAGRGAVAISGFTNTWRLNREKSDIPPVTKSQLLTIQTESVRVAMREILVDEKGETLTIAVEGRFDGLDDPVTGTPFADTVSYRLVALHVIEGVAKKVGVVVRETAILADDGLSVAVT